MNTALIGRVKNGVGSPREARLLDNSIRAH
jgi:hypothetical protein